MLFRIWFIATSLERVPCTTVNSWRRRFPGISSKFLSKGQLVDG